MTTDPVTLAAELVRCPSVTPEEGGAMALLASCLGAAGFACARADRGGVANLFARFGPKGAARSFGFNGHVDVVPPGPEADWRHPPFAGVIEGNRLWGRGAVDMKSGVAAFVAAAIDFAADAPPGDGAVILTITGDEEGPARDGTAAILDWMEDHGERMDACLVGEPTCPARMGEMIKIGRRGSLTADFTATGVQGHSAYPHRARNPLPALVALLDDLAHWRLDEGTAHFDPSTLAITTIDTGNPAGNVIPGRATARVNIRFNDRHTGDSLTRELRARAGAVARGAGIGIDVATTLSGEAFLTPPGPLSDLVSGAVEAETGRRPALSTAGGTSDARFIRHHCPVVECGLVGATMHQADEHVALEDIRTLARIYRRVLAGYFGGRSAPAGDGARHA